MAEGRQFEKKPLNRHISATVSPILMEFGKVIQIGPLHGTDRHRKKPQKSRYHSRGWTDLREIWRDYTKWAS